MTSTPSTPSHTPSHTPAHTRTRPRAHLPRTLLRIHRTSLLTWTALVAAALVWLLWSTLDDAPSITALRDGCTARSGYCDYAFQAEMFSTRLGRAGYLLAYVSLAVAAFAGGALIGRELESGTARLAWTQGVSPTRWLVAKLTVPAVFLATGTAALVITYRWSRGATDDLLYENGWSAAGVFTASGPAAVAYVLCALAVGTLTALLLPRTLPALGVSVAVTGLLQLTLQELRPALWPTVTRTDPDWDTVLNPAWIVSEHRTTASRTTGISYTYHPESHFWPLHLVETGIVLTVAAVATAAAFRILRTRTA